MTKRAAIYVRVSTDKQTVENQLRGLYQNANGGAGRSSKCIRMPASAARRAVKTVQGSIACSRMRSGADLTL